MVPGDWAVTVILTQEAYNSAFKRSTKKKARVILYSPILQGKTLDEMGEMLKSGELFDCGPKRRQRQKKKY